MKYAQRILIFILLAFTFTLFATSASAQTTVPSSPSALPSTLYTVPSYVSPTSPLYTDFIVSNMFHTFSCLATGQSIIGQPCLTYKMTQNAQGLVQGVPVLSQINTSGGILGTTTNLIGMLFQNPPVRTADYLATVGHGLGIAKEARAQGVAGAGATVLSPILKLWQVSRNISYVVMIVIFVIIGMMVMFRNKINPQTVITAQAALPGLVIGLILITFSYFLAGLLVDTAFIGTNVVGAYFSAAQQSPSVATPDCPNPNDLAACLKKQNVLSIMSTFVGAVGQGDLYGAVSDVLNQLGTGPSLVVRTFAGFLAYQYGTQFGELPATAISGTACITANAIGWLDPGSWLTGASATQAMQLSTCIIHGAVLARQIIGFAAMAAALINPAYPISWALYVILIAVLIYTMLKLLMRLVNNFISIIFYTITAPFQFLAASLPGRQGIVTGWILNMLCNVLAFPAVIAVFYFVNYLLGSEITGLLNTKPPFPVTGGALNLTGNGTLPLLGGMGTNFIRLILAYGLLLATPTIPDLICRALGRASQAGQMIGQEIGGGTKAGQRYFGQYAQGLQTTGTGISGQRQWTYNPNANNGKGGMVYVLQNPGAIDSFGKIIGNIKGRTGQPPLNRP